MKYDKMSVEELNAILEANNIVFEENDQALLADAVHQFDGAGMIKED
jgi:hypothetical protein